jgi:tRNA pseudouridine55 synthase
MDGVLNIDKPRGITSHDVVNRVRRILRIKKVGHTGTLDPEATGVLPVLVGKATKISRFLINSDKEYIATMMLGIKTDTGDSKGRVISEASGPFPSEREIRSVFEGFTGSILQIPPMYSAIKVNGMPLYSLARKGIEVERKAREVTVYSLDIRNIESTLITFRVHCSKGTYIRTLVSDIGDALGVGGHLVSLRRIVSGKFRIEDSVSLKELEEGYKNGNMVKGFYTVENALS